MGGKGGEGGSGLLGGCFGRGGGCGWGLCMKEKKNFILLFFLERGFCEWIEIWRLFKKNSILVILQLINPRRIKGVGKIYTITYEQSKLTS